MEQPLASFRNPHKLADYFKVHQSYLDKFVEDATIESFELPTTLIEGTPNLQMSGEIKLTNGARITVEKTYRTERRQDGLYVHTIRYSYNCSKPSQGNIFRYCSPHEDHRQFHHKHIFNPPGTETAVLEVTGNWPTLAQVISEASEIAI